MKQATRLQRPLPAKATTIDLASWLLISNAFFNGLGFIAGLATTAFNFIINLGLFFLGAL